MATLVTSMTSATGTQNVHYSQWNWEWANEYTPSSGFNLHSVAVWLQKGGSNSNSDYWIEVWDESGGEPNAVITNGTSTTTYAWSDLTWASAKYTFTFSPQPSLSGSTTYFFVIRSDDTEDQGANYVKIDYGNNGGGMHRWELETHSGDNWIESTGTALCMEIYEEADTVGDFYLFNDYADHLGEKIHDFNSHTFKVGLVTSTAAPTQSSVAAWGTFSGNEVSGTGYTPGGNALAGTSFNEAAGTATFDANDLTFLYNAAGPTNARYAIIYNDSDTTTPKAAIGYMDFGEDKSLQDGDLKLQWAGTGIHRVLSS